MSVHTTRETIRPKLDEYLTETMRDDEEFVAAMPSQDANRLWVNYLPWFGLTTHRLIRFNDFLLKRHVADFKLADVTHVEHKTSFAKHTWAVAGDGLYQQYSTHHPEAPDFIDHLRRQL